MTKRRPRRTALAVVVAALAAVFGSPPVAEPSPDTVTAESLARLTTTLDDAMALTAAAFETAPVERTPAPRRTVPDLLAELDAELAVAGDAATVALDRAIDHAGALSRVQRATIARAIDHQIFTAVHDLTAALDRREFDRAISLQLAALDQIEVDEHRATLDRLIEVRDLVSTG